MTDQIAAAKIYESLAARMQAATPPVRSWGFTSASGREGTSTTVLGTAIALTSLQSEPVLVIDANSLAPSLSQDARASGADLHACLRSRIPLAEALVAARVPNLFLLPSVTASSEPPLDRLATLLSDASTLCRYVLVDLPPILRAPAVVMSWASALAELVVVVDRSVTRGRFLKRALRELAPVRQPAVVLNR